MKAKAVLQTHIANHGWVEYQDIIDKGFSTKEPPFKFFEINCDLRWFPLTRNIAVTFRQPSDTGLWPWGSQLKKVETILHTQIANDGWLEYRDINEEFNAI